MKFEDILLLVMAVAFGGWVVIAWLIVGAGLLEREDLKQRTSADKQKETVQGPYCDTRIR